MADEQENNQQQPPATGEQPQPAADGGELGDAGKQALAAERTARREAEKQRKELEARLKELEPLAAKAQQLEDAKKSEAEKLNEKLTAAEKRAIEAETKALRLEVATAKGLTPAQAKRLVGATKDELEADADDLLSTFGGTSAGDGKQTKGRRPVENLRPGGMPNPPDPTVAEQIAAAEKAGKWDEAARLKTAQLMALTNPNK
jgi:hypothetical protein